VADRCSSQGERQDRIVSKTFLCPSISMPDTFSKLLIVSAAAVVALVAIWYYLMRRKKEKSAEIALPLAMPLQRPTSPMLDISFDNALEGQCFATAVAHHAKDLFNYELGFSPADAVIQAVSLIQSDGKLRLLCEASERGTQLLRSGKAELILDRQNGKLLPILRDSDTKKFLETLRGSPDKLAKLAEISALVVSLAHVISGMDLSKKLDAVNKKLDDLIVARRIDQYAALREIYTMSQERLSRMSQEDIADLRRNRGRLFNLRTTWLMEFNERLNSPTDPAKHSKLNPFGWRRGARERRMLTEVTERADHLQLIRVAIYMDLCLAEATGTLDLLLGSTLPQERASLERVLVNYQSHLTKICALDASDALRGRANAVGAALAGLNKMLGAATGN
jgi:hypothetical protein